MLTLRRFLLAAPVFLLALLLASPAVYAQLSTRATVTGTVTDSTGAVVQDAKVTITDNTTKVSTVSHDKHAAAAT